MHPQTDAKTERVPDEWWTRQLPLSRTLVVA